MNIENKIKKLFAKKKVNVITVRRIDNEMESKKQIPFSFTDDLLRKGFFNLTTEEILFQLKRDRLAKAFLQKIKGQI